MGNGRRGGRGGKNGRDGKNGENGRDEGQEWGYRQVGGGPEATACAAHKLWLAGWNSSVPFCEAALVGVLNGAQSVKLLKMAAETGCVFEPDVAGNEFDGFACA